jgi:cellobiose phosphorylase
MYQGLVNWFLGIRKEADHLIIDPSTPASFGDYTVEYKYGSSRYEIKIVSRSKGMLTSEELTFDNKKVVGNRIKLLDDGEIHVIVV